MRTENNKELADHLSFLQQQYPPQDGFYFGVIFAERTVISIFRQPKFILSPADINLLLQYSIEHDERLKQCAPLFFKMCVPGLSEELRMEVFY